MRLHNKQTRRKPFAYLGDYPANLPHRVLMTQGGGGDLGPIDSPIVPKDSTSTRSINDILEDILAVLKAIPWMNTAEQRKQLMLPGRDAIYWTSVGGPITVAPSSSSVVCSYATNSRYAGALQRIGVQLQPDTAFDDVEWAIRINGIIHPYLNKVVLPSGTIPNPLPFPMEITQKSVIELIAINTSSTDNIDVSAIMLGFTEYISDWKQWGTSPESGIG